MVVFYHHFEHPLSDIKWERCLSGLPQNMVEVICRYRRWQDRHSSLFGKLLIQEGLKFFGINSNMESVQFNRYGRPYIPGNIDFNISHSRDYVVCAFSRSGKIGIDIEYIDESVAVEDFKNVLTQDEWDSLQKSSDKAGVFFDYWCKKESIIKADGRGFSAPVMNIELSQNKAMLEGKAYYLKEIQLSQNYKVFVAKNTPIRQIKIIEYRFT